MACELCDIESLLRTDEGGNPCQDAEEAARSRACDDCGANLTNAQMWEGKQTGMKLCDPCFKLWQKAGRARAAEG